MTNTKHTPGPWELVATVHSQRKHIFGVATDREYYIGTLISGSQKDLPLFLANARLMATAPVMLEALIAAFDEMDNYNELVRQQTENEPIYYRKWRKALRQARAVIAMVEG